MGVLKELTKEYFGETIRKEDEINIDGLDVEIVSFTDNNGNIHRRGYKPKDKDNLIELLERMIEKRGNDGDFNDIDTSDFTSMESLFRTNETFNGDITGWDVSKVENMKSMFFSATSFNQPIGNWDVSNVEDMSSMFSCATSFNQPIGDWDVSGVKNMSYMFCDAKSFDQDLSEWNLNGKITMNMFDDCPIRDEYNPKK